MWKKKKKVLHEAMKISINKEELLLYCASQMWKSWRLFMIQIPYGAVYFNATESITWPNEDLNQQRRIIVILYIPNVEVMKSFYKSNNWWCTLLEGNRNKILQWNNYKIIKKQRKNHSWRTRIFNGTTFRIIIQELPFASKLSYGSRINEYQGVIIRHWLLLD